MKIVVLLKQTPDTESVIRIGGDGKSIATNDLKWIINPYDEYAIELGLQLTEKNGGEVTIISFGPKSIEPTIRSALAMGAHKAIRIEGPKDVADPLVTARALATVRETANMIIILECHIESPSGCRSGADQRAHALHLGDNPVGASVEQCNFGTRIARVTAN